MSEVSDGPVSTLPGHSHHLPDGATCDYHPERRAVARIQGETDSFGCEMSDLCADCLKSEREYARSPEARTGTCEWCEQASTDLSPTRDYEEGMSGRVYNVCGACRKRRDDADREWLRQREHEWDGDFE